MKRMTTLTALAAFLLFLAAAAGAQDLGQGNGVCQFIDEDGDGFNDLAPDADGDGIPNGLDPDYVKPEDGTGYQHKWASAYGELFRRMFGLDVARAMGPEARSQWGPGDGTGGGSFGPGPGTGTGGDNGTGGAGGDNTQHRRGGRR